MNRNRPIPSLLVSVRSVEEAAEALAGGADILDVKEPANGALGRASDAVLAEIVASATAPRDSLDSRRIGFESRLAPPITVALGELSEWDDRPTPMMPAGVWLAKLGLAGERERPDWRSRLNRIVNALPTGVGFAVAAYADADLARAPTWRDALEAVGRPRFLLLDTWSKRQPLWASMGPTELAEIRRQCDRANVGWALAGSLRTEDLPRLSAFVPDVVAVRGAACEAGDRRGRVDRQRVAELRQALGALADSLVAAMPTR